jgi:hypothetical protein
MAMSTDVNLPKAHDAKYPDRCVVCGAISPSSRVRVITGTIGHLPALGAAGSFTLVALAAGW